MQFNHEYIKSLKEQYPPGTRIELISMSDPQAVPPGSMGAVRMVDDVGTLHMLWDNGRGLGIVPGKDQFRVISRPEQVKATYTFKLYSPLSATYYEPDPHSEYGTDERECDLHPDSLAGAQSEILEAIDHWILPEERDRGIIPVCDMDDPLISTIQSVFPTVEYINDELWGVGIFKMKEAPNDREISELKSWWNTQLLDVFHQDFSQVGISCEYGEIFVNFWSDDSDWHIYVEDEMYSQLPEMGGQTL